ncbi:hypothetical protein EP331_11420 [bacterium]|nr:MAG: hypothetical protein EP331_11420 [bacterium]
MKLIVSIAAILLFSEIIMAQNFHFTLNKDLKKYVSDSSKVGEKSIATSYLSIMFFFLKADTYSKMKHEAGKLNSNFAFIDNYYTEGKLDTIAVLSDDFDAKVSFLKAGFYSLPDSIVEKLKSKAEIQHQHIIDTADSIKISIENKEIERKNRERIFAKDSIKNGIVDVGVHLGLENILLFEIGFTTGLNLNALFGKKRQGLSFFINQQVYTFAGNNEATFYSYFPSLGIQYQYENLARWITLDFGPEWWYKSNRVLNKWNNDKFYLLRTDIGYKVYYSSHVYLKVATYFRVTDVLPYVPRGIQFNLGYTF